MKSLLIFALTLLVLNSAVFGSTLLKRRLRAKKAGRIYVQPTDDEIVATGTDVKIQACTSGKFHDYLKIFNADDKLKGADAQMIQDNWLQYHKQFWKLFWSDDNLNLGRHSDLSVQKAQQKPDITFQTLNQTKVEEEKKYVDDDKYKALQDCVVQQPIQEPTEDEKKVDAKLKELIADALKTAPQSVSNMSLMALENKGNLDLSSPFEKAQTTQLFKLLKKMPKGVIHHLHPGATYLKDHIQEIFKTHADRIYYRLSPYPYWNVKEEGIQGLQQKHQLHPDDKQDYTKIPYMFAGEQMDYKFYPIFFIIDTSDANFKASMEVKYNECLEKKQFYKYYKDAATGELTDPVYKWENFFGLGPTHEAIRQIIHQGKPQNEKEDEFNARIWSYFEAYFDIWGDILKYNGPMKDGQICNKAYENMFKQFAEENVQTIEMRHKIPSCKNGKTQKFALDKSTPPLPTCIVDYDNVLIKDEYDYLNSLKETLKLDWTIIVSGFKKMRDQSPVKRSMTFQNVKKIVDTLTKELGTENDKPLREAIGKKFIGVDVINEEDHDMALTIEESAGTLLQALALMRLHLNKEAQLFIHAGENINVIKKQNPLTAMYLGAKRLGHGFSISQSVPIIAYALQRDVALEICPISNKFLGYTRDLANHPAPFLQNVYGVPTTISPDDPSIYAYKGVTFDWYSSWIAWQNWNDAKNENFVKMTKGFNPQKVIEIQALKYSILDFKKMALNSIKYSGYSKDEKDKLTKQYEELWKKWIDDAKGVQLNPIELPKSKRSHRRH